MRLRLPFVHNPSIHANVSLGGPGVVHSSPPLRPDRIALDAARFVEPSDNKCIDGVPSPEYQAGSQSPRTCKVGFQATTRCSLRTTDKNRNGIRGAPRYRGRER